MKGNPDVISQLQKLLASGLAAIDQYFIHSRIYEDWGYTRLYERLDHETEEEKEHADKIIKGLLAQTAKNLQQALRVSDLLEKKRRHETSTLQALVARLTTTMLSIAALTRRRVPHRLGRRQIHIRARVKDAAVLCALRRLLNF